MGRPPRPAVPRRRLRRLGRGAPGRLGGAQLEAGRPGHRPLQLRRRPGPVGPRRLDARRQPAHLGLRDELRRPGRPRGREGQPADAQAGPPHVGGGGGQRAVQLAPATACSSATTRGADEAGRRRAGLGRHRRHRRLRRAVRPQRWRHPGRRGVVAGAGPSCCGRWAASTSSTARPAATSSGPTSTPRTRASGGGSARTSAALIGRDPDIVFEHPGRSDHGRVGVRRRPRRHDRHLRGHQRLHDRVRQPPPLDEAEDASSARHFANYQRGVGGQPAHRRGQDPADPVAPSTRSSRSARPPTRCTTTCTRARSACCASLPRKGSASTIPSSAPKVGEDKITLFRRHGAYAPTRTDRA